MADTAAAPGAEPLPEDANETLYIQNLNERVKVPVLKKSLEALFSTYGQVLSVVAHGNLRMRGQAFVSFTNKRTATKAMKEVNGFPLYGKAMVRGWWLGRTDMQRVAFARSRSDSVVLRKAGPPGSEEREKTFNAHKAQRLAQKQVSRRINPLRRREMLRHVKAAKGACFRGCARLLTPAQRQLAKSSKRTRRRTRAPRALVSRRRSCPTSTCRRTRSCSCSSCRAA